MTPLIYVIEWLFHTTILFWCHKGNFEGHSILFYYDFVVTSTPVTMAFGCHISGKQQHTAHFSQPDEQSRERETRARAFPLGRIVQCCGRLVWPVWQPSHWPLVVMGMCLGWGASGWSDFFLLRAGAQHLPRALKRTAHPSLDIQNLITCIYVLIEPAIFSS